MFLDEIDGFDGQMNKLIPILLGFLMVACASWLHFTAYKPVRLAITWIDNRAYDIQLRSILNKASSIKSPIAIIDIDDKSLKEEGRWPWSRDKVAQLISRLHQMGAAVIAFDITFPEEEKNTVNLLLEKTAQLPTGRAELQKILQQLVPYFNYDQILEKSLQQTDAVLAITFHNNKRAVQGQRPKPLLQLDNNLKHNNTFISASSFTNNIPLFENAAKASGFINVLADDDGIIRRVPLVIKYEDDIYPSLALAAAQRFLLNDVKLRFNSQGDSKVLDGIELGKRFISTDKEGQVLIPFAGPMKSFPYISATDILNQRIASEMIAGKLLFIGTSATGLGDLQTTAIGNAYPGVEVHANIANALIDGRFPYRPAWTTGAEFVLTLIVGGLFSVLFPFLAPRWLAIFTMVTPAVLLIGNAWLFGKSHLVFSMTVTILLIIVLAIINMGYGYLFESRRREQLKLMFGEYVPPAYIDMIVKYPQHFGRYSENREMTVLFADIRNFTTLSENMNAPAIKVMLNMFFTPMTQIIFDKNGTIDKYVGDMIMAFWGAPLPDTNHRAHAIEAALAMQAKVTELKLLFKDRGLPEINIGIGLNTGLMSVGDMGSEFRRAYTVIGDAVNLGSRLESLTKYYGVGIIVGAETQRGQDDFVFRKLDHVKVKGKEIAVDIYEPLGKRSEISQAVINEVDVFEHALSFYLNQQWDLALNAFNQLIASYPNTMLYYYYLEQILVHHNEINIHTS